ncbi:hypothetical protein INR49_024241, partial [Caranx melampygus]
MICFRKGALESSTYSVHTSMPSLTMEGEKERLHSVLEDGLSSDLLNAGRFCFSCEQIFSDRISLEEHVCSAASYICSCGTEFTQYSDMLEHSTKHEPGHQVLDHQTIRKRRFEKRIEEEEKLQRLQTGEVVWSSVPSVKPLPQLPITSAHMKTPTNSPPGMLSKTMSPAKIGFICRVCHIAFESAQLLQRHKCIKAQEFMAQQ